MYIAYSRLLSNSDRQQVFKQYAIFMQYDIDNEQIITMSFKVNMFKTQDDEYFQSTFKVYLSSFYATEISCYSISTLDLLHLLIF